MKKTIGELIDALITTNIRCWMAQDSILDEDLPKSERLGAAILAQETNARRTQLIRAIDELLGDGDATKFVKSYDR